jgi:hypothetical protein
MKKLIPALIMFLLTASHATPQSKTDTLTDELKAKILNNAKNFSFGLYLDAYLNMELETHRDTSNVVPFSANCPVKDQIRLNVAAIEIYYNAEKVRGKLQLQFGDAPNLLAAPDAQFIKSMRQANFGFRIVKDFWIDIGYLLNPIGYESAWPIYNQISTATICGYFEPGNVVGVKLSYKFSEKFSGGIMTGNPYSLAYEQNNHLVGIIFLKYMPTGNLSVMYNNLFGNQAMRNADIKNNLLYNQFIITYDPIKSINLVGQFDFGFMTNSQMPPDTNEVASMCSGFLQARYSFLKYFSIAGRYEYFHDPDGFLSGTYSYDGKTNGLTTNGMAVSLEYRPVKIGYLRMEYKYIHANNGNNVYCDNTRDFMQAIVFTTGVRF